MTRALDRALTRVTAKNYIINGGMQVSQENGTSAGTTSGYYAVDQWSILPSSVTTAAFSFAQVAAATPGGSTHRLRTTVTGAQATVGGSSLSISQKIEGYRIADLFVGTSSAKTVTLQLGIKAPVAGTYLAALFNGAGDSFVTGTFTVASGEINTDVVKTVTLALPTSGTWASNNTTGLACSIYLMHPSQTANVFATLGNVFEMFDVGLYEGAIAPAFQLPDYPAELALCQRYWESTYDPGTKPGTATLLGCLQMVLQLSGANISNSSANGATLTWKTTKRTVPTLTGYSPQNGTVGKAYDFATGTDVNVSFSASGVNGTRLWQATAANAISTLSLAAHVVMNARM